MDKCCIGYGGLHLDKILIAQFFLWREGCLFTWRPYKGIDLYTKCKLARKLILIVYIFL